MMCICFHDYLVYVIKINNWHLIECKLSVFIALFALQNGTYQILAMTVDKYIAIKWPHKASTYSTPRRAKLIVILVYVCVFIYNIPHQQGMFCLWQQYGKSTFLVQFCSQCNNSFHNVNSHELCYS